MKSVGVIIGPFGSVVENLLTEYNSGGTLNRQQPMRVRGQNAPQFLGGRKLQLIEVGGSRQKSTQLSSACLAADGQLYHY
jgi:hypothetical protein